MRLIRTIAWIIFSIFLAALVFMNWGKAQEMRFWPLGDGNYLLFEWPVGFIALFFLMAGFLPMWLLHRGMKWRLNRRIKTLENALQANSLAQSETIAPHQTAEEAEQAS